MVGILLVLAIPLVGMLAVILGFVALVRINRSGGALHGRWLAVGAIVLGGLMLLATPVLLFAGLVARKSTSARSTESHSAAIAPAPSSVPRDTTPPANPPSAQPSDTAR
jgi:hypothetical protein